MTELLALKEFHLIRFLNLKTTNKQGDHEDLHFLESYPFLYLPFHKFSNFSIVIFTHPSISPNNSVFSFELNPKLGSAF